MLQNEGRRRFTRVPLRRKVAIVSGDLRIESRETRDVSLRGLYVLAPERLPAGAVCDVRVSLGEPEVQGQVSFRARVVRTDEAGLALEVIEIGLEAFHQLQRLLLYNSKDPDLVEREFRDHLGLQPRP